jgi:MoaA/NifB/PqqE/SkfB family radical SAM enzyme
MNNLSTTATELPYLGIRFQIRYYTCNLKCPYCIASWRKRQSPFEFDTFQNIIGKIKELPYRICLRIGVGGEIFTSPEILSVVKEICNEENNIMGVSFSSNIHASYKNVIGPFIDSINTGKLGMGCTLHDMVIKNPDSFFETVAQLKEKGVLLYVGNVAVPGRMEQLEEYKRKCNEIGVPLIINGLIGKAIHSNGQSKPNNNWLLGINWGRFGLTYPYYPRDYSPVELEQLKTLWFTPHSYQMLVNSSSTHGMQCSAGKNYIHIDHMGNVFPCLGIKNRISNVLFPALRQRYSMGNILEDKIRFQSKDTICPRYHCWCGNENQALRIVDKYYHRTRTLRYFYPKEDMAPEELYQGYNPSIYRFWRTITNPGHYIQSYLQKSRQR